jgi:hypothetical protein
LITSFRVLNQSKIAVPSNVAFCIKAKVGNSYP